MSFSNEDNARIKNLCQFKEYGSQRILTEFSKINCKREGLDTAQKDLRSTEQRHERRIQKHTRTEKNVTTVECG